MRVVLVRRSVVRRVCRVFPILLLLACRPESGTTQPSPAPATVVAAPAFAPASTIVEVPPEPAQPIVDPSTQPRLEVVSRKLDSEQREMGVCPFEVRYLAFPAISADDDTTLVAAQTAELSRVPKEYFVQLTWLGVDETRIVPVYNHGAAEPFPEEETPNCKDTRERLDAQVAALNTELASHTWRPLEALEGLYSKPGWAEAHRLFPDGGELVDRDQVLAGLPRADRPIEILYHGGHFIARVRDFEVLQKTARPEWSQTYNEFCGVKTFISAVDFDRATGHALVRYNFDEDGGCLCDDPNAFGRIELSPELLAAAEQRSMKQFWAAYELAMQEFM
jgi:hypothetical protein